MLRLSLISLSIILMLCLVFLTGQSGQPQTMPVFGVSRDNLALDGIFVYPPDGNPSVNASDAEASARGDSKREEPVKAIELVNLKLEYPKFDGLAWAVSFDVRGTKVNLPEPPEAKDTPYYFTFDITFVDAATGEFLTRLVESSPDPNTEPYRP